MFWDNYERIIFFTLFAVPVAVIGSLLFGYLIIGLAYMGYASFNYWVYNVWMSWNEIWHLASITTGTIIMLIMILDKME